MHGFGQSFIACLLKSGQLTICWVIIYYSKFKDLLKKKCKTTKSHGFSTISRPEIAYLGFGSMPLFRQQFGCWFYPVLAGTHIPGGDFATNKPLGIPMLGGSYPHRYHD